MSKVERVAQQLRDSGLTREGALRAIELAFPKEVGETCFNFGDWVRLTGTSWAQFDLDDEVVQIISIDTDGEAGFEHSNYPGGFVIFADTEEDYSATLVEKSKENA